MPPQARLMVLLGLLPVDLLDRWESSLPEPSPVMPGFCMRHRQEQSSYMRLQAAFNSSLPEPSPVMPRFCGEQRRKTQG
jgi:predicted lysophospholipase L1 biosynthesis ABC-type transport system permease subunit